MRIIGEVWRGLDEGRDRARCGGIYGLHVINDMHEAMHAIDPVVKVVFFFFWVIVVLSRSSRESIRAMSCAWYVDESEMKQRDGDDPSVDCSVGSYVRMLKHAFDIARVYFDNKVANANDI